MKVSFLVFFKMKMFLLCYASGIWKEKSPDLRVLRSRYSKQIIIKLVNIF